MRITRFTDYSLRILIFLAVNDHEFATINEIADRYHISKNHLMKIVQKLALLKYVIAVRGKNGGITLNGKPSEINIGSLVRAFEEETTLVECFGEDNQCVITSACHLKSLFAGALKSFYSHLEQYTLADLLNGDKQKNLNLLLGSKSQEEGHFDNKRQVQEDRGEGV